MQSILWKLSVVLLFVFAMGVLILARFLPSNTGTITKASNTALTPETPTENLCGPLSLLEVCQLYRIEADVEELTVLSKTEARGTSLEGIFEASQRKGLQPVALHTTIDELAKRAGPVILHVNGNHFFVVEKIEGADVHILDPPKKPYIISKKRLSDMWEGTALCFEKPLPNSPDSLVSGVEELIYDIGTIQFQETVVEKTFHLTNFANVSYTVSNIDSSCLCSTTLLQIGTVIRSKETKLVDMRVSLSEKSSRFEESMKIYVNDSKEPRYILTIRGTVKLPLRLSPKILYAGKFARTETIERQATLIGLENQNVQITSIETSSPAIAVEPIYDGQNSNHVTLHIAVSGLLLENSESNTLDEMITIYTNIAEKPELELPVQGLILDAISCVPNTIFFGVIDKGQSTSKTAKILVRVPSTKLVNARSHSEWLHVDLKSLADQTKYEMTVTLLPATPSGALKTNVEIFAEPHTQPLEIPVYAMVKQR
ncbi:MAG: cysteine peptidase family C39 domain-containing protein [Candidatus Poribacteria bacterium]|nr:cysteine peptidase family C39 domain-containing protein [Candidatus Poribacteria bacterium]